MKFYTKDNMVGIVLTKTELAALYAGHSEAPHSAIIERFKREPHIVGQVEWDFSDNDKLYQKMKEFLKDHNDG